MRTETEQPMADEIAGVVTIPTLYARIHLCTTCTTCETIPCVCEDDR